MPFCSFELISIQKIVKPITIGFPFIPRYMYTEGMIFVQSTEMEEKFSACIFKSNVGNKRIITI